MKLFPAPFLAVILSALATSAVGLERGQTAEGVKYVSGGVGESERLSLRAERKGYTLWITTVAKGSGAYLSDAHVRIVRADDNQLVLDRDMDGPWLLAALSPGRYHVSASLQPAGADKPQSIMSTVRIRPGELRQAVMRFASSADVGSERHRAFGGNPFGDD